MQYSRNNVTVLIIEKGKPGDVSNPKGANWTREHRVSKPMRMELQRSKRYPRLHQLGPDLVVRMVLEELEGLLEIMNPQPPSLEVWSLRGRSDPEREDYRREHRFILYCSAVLAHVILRAKLLIFSIRGQAMSQLTMMEPDAKLNHTGPQWHALPGGLQDRPWLMKDIQDYMVEKLSVDKNISLKLCILLYKQYETILAGLPSGADSTRLPYTYWSFLINKLGWLESTPQEGKLSQLEHLLIRGSNEVCRTRVLPLGQYQMCSYELNNVM